MLKKTGLLKKTAAFVTLLFVTGMAQAQCDLDFVSNGNVDFTELLFVSDTVGPCAGCASDVNGNGVVGEVDYQIVLGNQGPCPIEGDVDQSGTVTITDMSIIINNLGIACNLDIDRSGTIDIRDLYIARASAAGSADADPRADVDGDGDTDSVDGDLVRTGTNNGLNCRTDVDKDGDVDTDDFDRACELAGFC